MPNRFRMAVLPWTVGGFCLVAGLLTLLVPHRFARLAAFATLQPHLLWIGMLYLLSGVSMVTVHTLAMSRRWVRLIHLLAGLTMLLIAGGYVQTRSWTGALAYTVLALGTVAAPWLTCRRTAVESSHVRPLQLYPLLLALVLVLTGLAMLLAPGEFDAPHFALLQPWLTTIGIVDLLGGCALAFVHLRPVPITTIRLVHVTAGSGMLAYVLLAPWANGNWVGLAYYAAFWVPLALFPWIPRSRHTTGGVSLAVILGLALALAAALPLVVAAVIDARLADDNARNEAQYDQQGSTVLLAEIVRSFVIAQRVRAEQLASEADLPGLEASEVKARLQERATGQSSILAFALHDPHGMPLGRSDAAPLTPVAGLLAFEAVRATRRPVTTFQWSASMGRPIIISAAPLLGTDGTLRAVASVSSDPARVLELLDANRPRGTEVILVDANLLILTSADPSQLGTPLDAATGAALQASDEQSGGLASAASSNQDLMTYEVIPELGWTLITKRPMAIVFANTYARRDQLLVFLLAAILVAILAASFVARRMSAPLTALATAVESFGNDKIATLPKSSIREAALLAAALTEAGDRLLARTAERERAEAEVRDLNAVLEERVRDRTALLATATERAERMAAIVESSDDAILSKDLAGIITSWNPAAERLYGYTACEIVGQSVALLIPPHLPDELGRLLAQVRQGLSVGAFDTVRVRKDGRLLEVSVRISPIRSANGTVVGASAIVRDMSGERERQRMAEQSEKLRVVGQLASGIAHDINQTLTLIAGHADLALATTGDEAPQAKQSLETIVRAVMDGAESVTRLLTFSRARSEKPPERVSVSDLLRDVAVLTAPRWRDDAQRDGKIIQMMTQTDRLDLAVLGQPDALREAFANLVLNAVDALPDGGSLRLEARGREDTVEIEVADDGVGMSEQVRTRVFEPFFTTKGARGTGLGLAMVFGIVEQHHGTITVESAPGRGTTFRIALPASGDPVAAPAALPPERVLTQPRHILAVDDHDSVLTLVKQILHHDGHTVVTALSGEDAVIALRKERFDLVVSDLGLGAGMTGWDLAAHVRRAYPNTLFILATGWGADIDPEEAHRRGIHAVVAKPYRSRTLHAIINGLPLSPARPSIVDVSVEQSPEGSRTAG